MNIPCLIFGIIFLVAGLLFVCGKLHIFIGAWKKMPEEEKNKIRIKPLCRNIGSIIMLSGILFLFGGIFATFREHWFVISMIIWLVIAGIDVFYIYKSKRYQNK